MLWIRVDFGDQLPRPSKKRASQTEMPSVTLTVEESQLVRRLRSLPEARRRLVLELVEQFVLDEEVWIPKAHSNR